MHKRIDYVGVGFVVLGIILFIIKMTKPEYVDAQGFLHESFGYIIMGYFSIFIGSIIIGLNTIVSKVRKQKK